MFACLTTNVRQALFVCFKRTISSFMHSHNSNNRFHDEVNDNQRSALKFEHRERGRHLVIDKLVFKVHVVCALCDLKYLFYKLRPRRDLALLTLYRANALLALNRQVNHHYIPCALL